MPSNHTLNGVTVSSGVYAVIEALARSNNRSVAAEVQAALAAYATAQATAKSWTKANSAGRFPGKPDVADALALIP